MHKNLLLKSCLVVAGGAAAIYGLRIANEASNKQTQEDKKAHLFAGAVFMAIGATFIKTALWSNRRRFRPTPLYIRLSRHFGN